MYKQILSLILLLAATIIVIIFAYYSTIIIGKKTNRLLDNKYTQVLERTMIGVNTNITILKINQKIYIVAMQGKTIQLLDIIEERDWLVVNDKNKIKLNKQKRSNNLSVNSLLNKIRGNFSTSRYDENGSDNDE